MGGRIPEVFDLMKELDRRTTIDEKNNVIAVCLMSHLNCFYSENIEKVHTVGPEYAFPEVFADYCDFKPKMVHMAKDNSNYHV